MTFLRLLFKELESYLKFHKYILYQWAKHDLILPKTASILKVNFYPSACDKYHLCGGIPATFAKRFSWKQVPNYELIWNPTPQTGHGFDLSLNPHSKLHENKHWNISSIIWIMARWWSVAKECVCRANLEEISNELGRRQLLIWVKYTCPHLNLNGSWLARNLKIGGKNYSHFSEDNITLVWLELELKDICEWSVRVEIASSCS